jgi:hypothetical protein
MVGNLVEWANYKDPEQLGSTASEAAPPTKGAKSSVSVQFDDGTSIEMTDADTAPVVTGEAQRKPLAPTDSGAQVFHMFLGPMFRKSTDPMPEGESLARMREGLPPVPDSASQAVTLTSMFRFKAQSLLTERVVPSKTLQTVLDQQNRKIAGVESQFIDLANSLNDRINRHIKKQPINTRVAVREQIESDASAALRGDNKAMERLPSPVRKVLEKGRDSIDEYSKLLIKSGLVSDEVKVVMGDRIGEYVKREYKVFDKDSNWNYETIKRDRPDIYEAALAEIMATGKKRGKKKGSGLTREEADKVIKEMTRYDRARGFLNGSKTVGKINVTNLIKRQEFSQPILDLLGEVTDPMVNLRNTGATTSKTYLTYQAQLKMAELMVEIGVASRTSTGRMTDRIGREEFPIPTLDEEGKPDIIHGERTRKSMMGFDGLFIEPELAAHLEEFFDGKGKDKSTFVWAFDQIAKITSVSKFSMVILNPAAYPTNFLGGVATEIFNGRAFFRGGAGAKAYLKFGSFRDVDLKGMRDDPYGVTEQMKFHSQSGKDVAKAGGVNSFGRNQLNTEMQQRGLLDNSVGYGDFMGAVDAGWGHSLNGGVKKFARAMSKLYQASDNAIKRSAFAHELTKWMEAEPNKQMDELMDLAAEDVRATTQNYDQVPKVIKAFSQRGIFISTFISFSYELLRNTKGTAVLAARELASGNPVLRRAGMRRIAGMTATAGLLYGLNSMLSAFMTGLDDEEREELRSALPPWLKDSEVVYLKAGNGKLRYFDATYVIPHNIFYNAVKAAVRGEGVVEKMYGTLGSLKDSLGGMNILTQTAAEAIANEKVEGGKVYNELIAEEQFLGKTRAITKHFAKSMFTPGVKRTWDKVEKAKKNEVDDYGGQPSEGDVWLNLLGIRPYTVNTASPEFINSQLSEFSYDNRKIKSWVSTRKQQKRGKDEQVVETIDGVEYTESQLKARKQADKAFESMKERFKKTLQMFDRLDIPASDVREGMKEAGVSKELRDAIKN